MLPRNPGPGSLSSRSRALPVASRKNRLWCTTARADGLKSIARTHTSRSRFNGTTKLRYTSGPLAGTSYASLIVHDQIGRTKLPPFREARQGGQQAGVAFERAIGDPALNDLDLLGR